MNNVMHLSTELKGGKLIEIIRVGNWKESYKNFEITIETLNDFVSNFEKNTLKQREKELQLNFSHKNGERAAGWITSLKVEDGRLLASVRWTPAGAEAIKNKEFKYISAEFSFLYEDDETGEETKNVLLGAGLTNIPFVSDLETIKLAKDSVADNHERQIFHFLNPMEKFQKFLESFAEKKLSQAEFSQIQGAFLMLSDEDQKETKDSVDDLEKKIEEETPTEKEEEKEELSKTTLDQDLRLSEAEKQLSAAHSEIDKMKSQQRLEKTKMAVELLAKEGKLIGENIVDKTAKQLCSMTEKQASSFMEILSSQGSQINLSEIGTAKESDTQAAASSFETFASDFREKNINASGTQIIDAFLAKNPGVILS